MDTAMHFLAPAKINLSLDVLKRRDDGYHIVEMVVQTIDLCDSLYIQPRFDGRIKVLCSHPLAPGGPKNLVYQAAARLKSLAGAKPLGATIKIVKRIPVAAGLGGGSADAAAALKGLNLLWDLRLPPTVLAQVALELGADVPFCLRGGAALVGGVGEELTSLPPPPKLWVVLLKPQAGIGTAVVYSKFRQARVLHRPDTKGLISTLAVGDLSALSGVMANVLESVTFSLAPELNLLKSRAMDLGALAAQMSGSGPTVFALAKDFGQAQIIYQGLKNSVDFAHLTTFKEETL